MTRPPSRYRPDQRVRYKDGREGVLVRQVSTYPQWLVRLDDGRVTSWWESEFEPAEDRPRIPPR